MFGVLKNDLFIENISVLLKKMQTLYFCGSFLFLIGSLFFITDSVYKKKKYIGNPKPSYILIGSVLFFLGCLFFVIDSLSGK